jgi:hypothetical protein
LADPNDRNTSHSYRHNWSYAFYSIARDLTGNVENAKSVAEATTTVTVVSTQTIHCTGCYFLINNLRATLAFNVAVQGASSTFSYNYRSATQIVQFASTTTTQISFRRFRNDWPSSIQCPKSLTELRHQSVA